MDEDWQQVYGCDFGQDNGSILMMSTPKGNNHFYDLWQSTVSDKVYEPLTFHKLQETVNKIKGINMYGPEGCAPERPSARERLAKQSPSTAVMLELAEEKGYLQAKNRFILDEAQAFEQKLNKAEEREAQIARSLEYYQRQAERNDNYAAELEVKVEKLEKKLAPKKKKVVKKTKKVSKK